MYIYMTITLAIILNDYFVLISHKYSYNTIWIFCCKTAPRESNRRTTVL